MPLSSMTGFARHEGDHEKFHWAWEIRSVNSRNLDVRVRVPSEFNGLESEVRKKAGAHFKRGSLQISLHLQRHTQSAQVEINEAALAKVMEAMSQVADKVKAAPPTLDGILSLRGVLEVVESSDTEEEKSDQLAVLFGGFDRVLAALGEARNQEGVAMEAVIIAQVSRIEELTTEAFTLAATTPQKIRARLLRQVEELISEGAALPEERLAQEIAILVSKADIREELDRLKAHTEAARDLIAQEGPVGRKLDFLTQEFNRESNTLCSKAADVSLTRVGLELKSVVEQLREQVQNIE
jgi:uncharacterized protein (TIGR00255 family)